MPTPITATSDTLLASLPTSAPVELSGLARAGVSRVVEAAPPGSDTVTLSVPAQVRQLVQQGQSATQIATTLGLSAGLLNNYLYVPLSTVAANATGGSPVAGIGL